MDENMSNEHHRNALNDGKVRRIASEGNKLFWVKETGENVDKNRFRYDWMDNQTKAKRQEYMNRNRYSSQKKRRRRKSKWAVQSDYIAKTLKIEMEQIFMLELKYDLI